MYFVSLREFQNGPFRLFSFCLSLADMHPEGCSRACSTCLEELPHWMRWAGDCNPVGGGAGWVLPSPEVWSLPGREGGWLAVNNHKCSTLACTIPSPLPLWQTQSQTILHSLQPASYARLGQRNSLTVNLWEQTMVFIFSFCWQGSCAQGPCPACFTSPSKKSFWAQPLQYWVTVWFSTHNRSPKSQKSLTVLSCCCLPPLDPGADRIPLSLWHSSSWHLTPQLWVCCFLCVCAWISLTFCI